MENATALDRAIAAAGGMRKLARQMHITPQALSGWRLRGAIPHMRVRQVAEVTGIPIWELRPDVYKESDT
jgi:DNA-binding transcriptional regulator YdaS (Cro superfamily)